MFTVGRPVLNLSADLVLIVAATVAALVLRENMALDAGKLRDLVPYLIATIAVAAPVCLALGLDRALWRYSSMTDFYAVAMLAVITTLGATLAMFIYNRMDGVARSVPVLQFILTVAALTGARVMVRSWHQSRLKSLSARAMAANGAQAADDCVLLVGVNSLTWLVLRAVQETEGHNLRVAGVISHEPTDQMQMMRGHRVYSARQDLAALIKDLGVHGMRVNRVIVTVDEAALTPSLREALHQLRVSSGISVERLAEVIGLRAKQSGDQGAHDRGPTDAGPGTHDARAAIEPVAEDGSAAVAGQRQPHLVFDCAHAARLARRPYMAVKRALDMAVAAVALVLLWPLIVVVAAAVRLGISNQVIFPQDRPGLGGVRFPVYKFTTMGDSHDAAGNAVADDQRINRVGAFLRKTRLDELPQLWNILRGDMSFVGPRPLLVADHAEGAQIRQLVRPGLTGWAQVVGGRAISATDKMVLDAWYVNNASLWLDLKIVLKTLPMILFGERVSREAISRAWQELRDGTMAAQEADSTPQRG
ncbi:MAG: sugar transferase [Hyphomicrobiaceae bacterium]|nr:sugar transferase [Hyphomicrobiaceae bacterium]